MKQSLMMKSKILGFLESFYKTFFVASLYKGKDDAIFNLISIFLVFYFYFKIV